MRSEERATLLWHGLSDCASIDRRDTITTVNAWLEFHCAGYPDVPLLPEKVRDDAQFWAQLAVPDELAAYFLAASDALGKTPLTQNQTKKMIASCFGRLSSDDREGFIKWAQGQMTTTGST